MLPPGGDNIALEPIPLVGSSISTKEPLANNGSIATPEESLISLKPCAMTLAPTIGFPTKSVI